MMKSRPHLKLFLGLLLLTIVFVVMTFFMYFYTRGGTRVTKLPGDYQAIRLHGNSVVISRRSNACEVIGSPVDGFAVYEHIVVGHVGDPEPGQASDNGYFVIDTRQHTVKKRLERKAYLGLLHRYGISSERALQL